MRKLAPLLALSGSHAAALLEGTGLRWAWLGWTSLTCRPRCWRHQKLCAAHPHQHSHPPLNPPSCQRPLCTPIGPLCAAQIISSTIGNEPPPEGVQRALKHYAKAEMLPDGVGGEGPTGEG